MTIVIYPKATVVVGVVMMEDVVADPSSLFIAVLQTGVVLNLPNQNFRAFALHATELHRVIEKKDHSRKKCFKVHQ